MKTEAAKIITNSIRSTFRFTISGKHIDFRDARNSHVKSKHAITITAIRALEELGYICH